MAKSKVESYIGFCIKSGAAVFGAGAIDTLKGGVKLILLSGDAAANSIRLAQKYQRRFNCPVVICRQGLEEVTGKNCKLIALKNQSLTEAILNNLDDNYQLYAGGGNR